MKSTIEFLENYMVSFQEKVNSKTSTTISLLDFLSMTADPQVLEQIKELRKKAEEIAIEYEVSFKSNFDKKSQNRIVKDTSHPFHDKAKNFKEVEKSRAKLKTQKLPCIGLCEWNGERAEANIVTTNYQCLLQLDIDKKENRMLVGKDIEAVCHELMAIFPFLICCYPSPSGDGIKGIVVTDGTLTDYIESVRQIKIIFAKTGVTLDPAVLHPTALFFVGDHTRVLSDFTRSEFEAYQLQPSENVKPTVQFQPKKFATIGEVIDNVESAYRYLLEKRIDVAPNKVGGRADSIKFFIACMDKWGELEGYNRAVAVLQHSTHYPNSELEKRNNTKNDKSPAKKMGIDLGKSRTHESTIVFVAKENGYVTPKNTEKPKHTEKHRKNTEGQTENDTENDRITRQIEQQYWLWLEDVHHKTFLSFGDKDFEFGIHCFRDATSRKPEYWQQVSDFVLIKKGKTFNQYDRAATTRFLFDAVQKDMVNGSLKVVATFSLSPKELALVREFKVAIAAYSLTFYGNEHEWLIISDNLKQHTEYVKIDNLGSNKVGFAFRDGVYKSGVFHPFVDNRSESGSIIDASISDTLDYRPSDVSFDEWFCTIQTFGRNEATVCLSFFYAAVFSDIVFEKTGFFPLLHLMAPIESGKTTFLELLWSLYYSNPKAQKRSIERTSTSLASLFDSLQACNVPMFFDELNNPSIEYETLIRETYNRTPRMVRTMNGGTRRNEVTTPVSPIVLAGPVEVERADLSSRLIVIRRYKKFAGKLKEAEKMSKKGLSHLLTRLLDEQETVKSHFLDYYEKAQEILAESLIGKNIEINEEGRRQKNNFSCLLAIVNLLEDKALSVLGENSTEKAVEVFTELLSLDIAKRKGIHHLQEVWLSCWMAMLRDETVVFQLRKTNPDAEAENLPKYKKEKLSKSEIDDIRAYPFWIEGSDEKQEQDHDVVEFNAQSVVNCYLDFCTKHRNNPNLPKINNVAQLITAIEQYGSEYLIGHTQRQLTTGHRLGVVTLNSKNILISAAKLYKVTGLLFSKT